MELHPQLQRFLKKSQFSSESVPDTLENWQQFIDLISRSYRDFDQERYLLERSMNVSSAEMEEINQMLAESQRIIKMSYWKYEKNQDRFDWSTELSYLLGDTESYSNSATLKDFLNLLHDDDKKNFSSYFQEALSFLGSMEIEIRLGRENQAYRWFRMVSRFREGSDLNDHVLTGVLIDIQKQKMDENQILELNKQLLSAIEKVNLSAGVANTMLNSVSNVLGSISECIDFIKKSYSESNLSNLVMVKNEIQNHLHELPKYLSENEKGKLIPSYFISFVDQLVQGDLLVRHKVNNLDDSVQHIRDIVMMGRTLNGASDTRERHFLPELIDDAIYLCDLNYLKEKKISIKKSYQFTPFLMIERAKMLKILIHLIQNAKSALMEYRLNLNKTIEIQVEEGEQDRNVKIIVYDNGVGIASEYLDKIFKPGFTTRKNGQGQSLYSCLMCAKELGGSLEAKSEGEARGAQFILTVPLE